MYEMVSGLRAFQRDTTISTLSAVLRDEPKPLEHISHDLDTIIRRCLRKDPERRWQTAADLRVALRELGDNSDTQPAAIAPTAVKPPSHRWRLLTTLLVVPLLWGFAWYLLKYSGNKSLPPTLVQLTSYPGSENSPSFSPDGTQVAFSWDGEKGNNFDIYVKLIGESNSLRLTTDPAPELWPSWSPDGRHIAFQRNATDTAGIWLVSPLGGGNQKLADIRAMGQMSWSPDGKWLAVAQGFESWDVGATRGLFLVPVDGGQPHRVSNPQPPTYDIHPSFSRKDRVLAYARCTSDWACDVFVQELDASYMPKGEPRRITHGGAFVRGIAWSRDGKSLIYGASISWAMNPRLWRAGTNGKPEPERLDVAGFQAVTPAVAPVADQLAFTRVATNHDIWRYQLGGTPEPFLASSLHEWNPQFSSDGSRIAFASGRSGEIIEIWTAAADGSNPVQLTRNVGRGQGSPRWSPDDRFIAFDSLAEDGQSHIYIVDANGGRARPVTSGPYSEFVPNWSRDGKWLYFFSSRTGTNETWRVPVTGGAAQQVTNSGGDTAVETTDGKTLIYTKGRNAPLFARPVSGGSERQILDYVTLRSYAVVNDGIYYIGRSSADGEHPIAFYSFATEASSTLTRAKGPLEQGLSVSPDRRTILFSKSASTGADLMLLDNFR